MDRIKETATEGMDLERSKAKNDERDHEPVQTFGSPISSVSNLEKPTVQYEQGDPQPEERNPQEDGAAEQEPEIGDKRPAEHAEEAELEKRVKQVLGNSNRLRRLNTLFSQVLNNSFEDEGCRQDVEEALQALPEPYRAVMQDLLAQILQQVRDFCTTEFRDIVHDSQTDVLLNGFDLASERHLLSLGSAQSPGSLVSAERKRAKRAEIKLLRKTLEEGKAELQRAEEALNAKQAEVKTLTSSYAPIPGLLNSIEDADKQWKASFSQELNPQTCE